MAARLCLVLLFALVADVNALLAASPRVERKRLAVRCRAACGPAIVRCTAVEQRGVPFCRRRVLRQCRKLGLQVCVPQFGSTTTSTTPATTSTTWGGTSTTNPSETTTSTTTSSTTTVPTTLPLPPDDGPPWIESGPIQWSTLPPAEVVSGDTFPLALDVDVGAPWVAVEGTILDCVPRSSASECTEYEGTAAVPRLSFAGPPGRFELTGRTARICALPWISRTGILVPRVFLIDGAGNRAGPFFGPIAWTEAFARKRPEISLSTNDLAWSLAIGETAQPRSFGVYRSCGEGFPVSASTDVPWLSVEPGPGGFVVSVDDALVAAAGVHHGSVIVSVPDATPPERIVRVTVRRMDVQFSWIDLPASVAPGERFGGGLAVDGEGIAGTTATFWSSVPGTSREPFVYGPNRDWGGLPRSGDAGGIDIDASRIGDCPETAAVARLSAVVTPTDASGSPMGSFVTVAPPIGLPAATGPVIVPGQRTVTFNALVGRNPTPRTSTISVSCLPRGTADLAIGADVPWLSAVFHQGDEFGLSDRLRIAVDVAGLDPAQSPYRGTLQITSPVVAEPATVDVVLNLADIDVDVLTPAPTTIEVGQDFPLAFSVTGDVDAVSGTVRNCWIGSEEPLDALCISPATLGLGAFAGPPGVFTFAGHRYDYFDWSDTNELMLELYATKGDVVLGPFYPHLGSVDLPESSQSWLSVSPQRIDLLALAGQSPVSTTAYLSTFGDSIAWTATTDVPWLDVKPGAGSAYFGAKGPWIVADTTGLDPDASPFTGTITFHAPGSQPGAVSVPVTLTLVR